MIKHVKLVTINSGDSRSMMAQRDKETGRGEGGRFESHHLIDTRIMNGESLKEASTKEEAAPPTTTQVVMVMKFPREDDKAVDESKLHKEENGYIQCRGIIIMISKCAAMWRGLQSAANVKREKTCSIHHSSFVWLGHSIYGVATAAADAALLPPLSRCTFTVMEGG